MVEFFSFFQNKFIVKYIKKKLLHLIEQYIYNYATSTRKENIQHELIESWREKKIQANHASPHQHRNEFCQHFCVLMAFSISLLEEENSRSFQKNKNINK